MHFLGGMKSKTRGTALVEYAVLLLVLVSLAGIGFKRLGAKTLLGASHSTETIHDGLRDGVQQRHDADQPSKARHHECEERSRCH